MSRSGDTGRIVVLDSRHFGFRGDPSARFTPWGFNYDRTALAGRDVLLEDVLAERPAKLDEDFAAMRMLGGNVARVFVATHMMLRDGDHLDEDGIRKLHLLLAAAERQRIRLILVGLANIRPDAAPPWFQQADDEAMARAELLFWRTVARECRTSNAVFAYDLQNEPAIHWQNSVSWTDGCFNMSGGQRFCYVHRRYRRIATRWTNHIHERFASADSLHAHWPDYPRKGESWEEIAVPAFDGNDPRFSEYAAWQEGLMAEWALALRQAIRQEDTGHLITVGALNPVIMASAVDFYCAHLYPQAADSAEAFREKNRRQWAAEIDRLPKDKPLVIEEMYPLALAPGVSSEDYLRFFLNQTQNRVAGWVSFYWGEPATLPQANPLAANTYAEWLKVWAAHSPVTSLPG